MASNVAQSVTLLADYQPSPFNIPEAHLFFDLSPHETRVRSRLLVTGKHSGVLTLNAVDLQLENIVVNGAVLNKSEYSYNGEILTIPAITVPSAMIETTCIINPAANDTLTGLYAKDNMYCTQCEAEGFRRITPFIDRPDILTRFTVTINACKKQASTLLSNGNLIHSQKNKEGRYQVQWQDPYPKPCYLFALVAGHLHHIKDSYTTMSGRKVAIYFYVQRPEDLAKCQHALYSLKKAMQWDEQTYQREYDLDRYMVVAVENFNSGAMENKGLNVFNTQAVFVNRDITVDQRNLWVEAVIGHEYFHNWTGNRVTLRDWFQLSLKEGFTVFRECQFMATLSSPAVSRILQVKHLVENQFAEDAGELAHPVQPDSYQEIRNFYTATVYEKGAELIGMLLTILGESQFYSACNRYFEQYDGKATTIACLIEVMEEIGGVSLAQFMHWYKERGTPRLTVTHEYDNDKKQLKLNFKQTNQANKNYWIPLKLALFDDKGRVVRQEEVIHIKKSKQSICYKDIPCYPYISLLRQFSAPILLTTDLSEQQLLGLMRYDNDGYGKWQACQQLYNHWIESLLAGNTAKPTLFLDTLCELLEGTHDKYLMALLLTPPSMQQVANRQSVIDNKKIVSAIQSIRHCLGLYCQQPLKDCYQRNRVAEYRYTPSEIGKRSLKNTCLALWVGSGSIEAGSACYQQFQRADNMTDRSAALAILLNNQNNIHCKENAGLARDSFYTQFHHEKLAYDHWLRLQAAATEGDIISQVEQLAELAEFSIKNPNSVYALLGTLGNNFAQFHDAQGRSYALLAHYILKLDTINPEVGARLLESFALCKKMVAQQRTMMTRALTALSEKATSPNIVEMVTKLLAHE